MDTLQSQSPQPRVSTPAKRKLTAEEQYRTGAAQGARWLLQAQKRTKDKPVVLAALGAHWREQGPFEVVDAAGLQAFCADVLAYLGELAPPARIQPLDWPADASTRLAEAARVTAATTHSHTGRWVHPSSAARAWLLPQSAQSSFYVGYQQAAAVDARGASFSPAQLSALAMARPLLASFRWQGQVTTLAAQLARSCAATMHAFVAAGAREEHVRSARDAFARQAQGLADAKSLDAGLDGCLPQLLWPVETGRYLALSAMPSLTVSNIVSRLAAQARDHEQWVATASHTVGSGKAVNVSMAASESAGNVPLFKCLPPRPRLDETTRLARRAAAGALLNDLGEAALKRFDLALSTKSGAARRQSMRAVARSHAAIVLAPLFALREALELDASVAQRLPETLPAHQRAVLEPGAARPDRAECEALYRDVLGAGQQKVLLRHEPADAENYQRALRSAVDALVGF